MEIVDAEGRAVHVIPLEAFAHDNFLPILWTDGVFRATRSALQELEAQVDSCDFAVAIAPGSTAPSAAWTTSRPPASTPRTSTMPAKTG
ncbi:hypothetical protein [Microvirga tunisiensis]|uniref:Uncharacterized protein n=1 Tax=Microvirga tunisiensis TaxID=2108360 RepID=A0A5N7MPA5_9HYPH|nr:hypothetical protein [Microvirga tunisiensis]MPR10690.1 hypothetical protein [Microvirga tunisiensis]MPR28763.1 hypothetical protein [Microvirga tunisiensis]